MSAYYNENEPFAAQWLRNLIAAGHIAPGDVDDRSIVDIAPEDLRGYTQHHFFAGIGGWSYALRLAGWADDRPVWTGSCPCQPLSSAGQRKGHADERRLWPAFYGLIAERRPATVFGEQVAGALAREWLAGVRADLEAAGYAIGAADLCAASVDAPHIRQRLFWVAHADTSGQPRSRWGISGDASCGPDTGNGRWMGDASGARLSPSELALLPGSNRFDEGRATGEPGCSFWTEAEWLACLDGKTRRAQPGIFPLAHGVSGRMGKLRAAGNAVVPQVAAEFIRACMECLP